MNLIKLEIFTPDRKFFTGEVEHVIINTPTGEMGIMFNTLPIVTLLKGGVMKILQSNKWMEAVNSEGFVRISGSKVNVFTDECVWPYEVNEGNVQTEIDSLNSKAKKAQSMHEYKLAKAQLAIQFAKLKIKDHNI